MKLTVTSLLFLSFLVLADAPAMARNQSSSITGSVRQVWEDGFRLNSNGRSITVDTYDICGDNTTSQISVGDQVTITGEFDGGEFDAFSVTKGNGRRACQ
ncbi:hypothetical protein ACN23B_18655 [Anabaena sp. FACHB-709]|uniref:DUF5666 domain-containing protein n=2 Tax=Nostocaceae TaxID=1162 RepID=A0A1Z4KK41_ANAVA|nr:MULTISPECIES: hypothetical protein [Nostocaceae]BAY69340.1 hypothetical protein NIES23_21340 [Trichormus variabilis NIES-23]HBW28494.1 hypothetical protein [Nostoc sp. UBA8866]MBD2174498.1 hypothetical protein [Anabaena cylindrica FACHB-318]MBD2266258.1 hypothetical protein [Anabaena sp. FACHB-709]MBD2275633.1 hypothetical protein [Nostoc sp. PCC 7120 = FACHB-418]